MSKSSNAANTTKAVYESSVIHRAMDRAGNNPHLKGHIHEVLAKDGKNLRGLFTGQSTHLTKSTTASTVDLVGKQGNKIVERLQLKDTVSPSSVNKLVRQVKAGKYHTAKLVGTDETSKLVNRAFEKAGVAKRMSSSGISSKTTTTLAQRAGVSGSGSIGSAIAQSAKSGGTFGAAVSAGFETIKGVSDLIDGKRDVVEVGASIAKAGAKGYVTGAAASAAATTAGATVATGLAGVGATGVLATAATFAAPAVAVIAVGYLVGEIFDSIFD